MGGRRIRERNKGKNKGDEVYYANRYPYRYWGVNGNVLPDDFRSPYQIMWPRR
jgi:hypothetical protein